MMELREEVAEGAICLQLAQVADHARWTRVLRAVQMLQGKQKLEISLKRLLILYRLEINT